MRFEKCRESGRRARDGLAGLKAGGLIGGDDFSLTVEDHEAIQRVFEQRAVALLAGLSLRQGLAALEFRLIGVFDDGQVEVEEDIQRLTRIQQFFEFGM